jgi:PAS domain S-box-containing protein
VSGWSVLYHGADAATAEAVRAELTGAGHTVTAWHPGEPVPADARMLIVDGLGAASAAGEVPCDVIVLLGPGELTSVALFPHPLTDLVLTPLRAGEVALRVAQLGTLDPKITRERQRVLSLAVEASSDVVEMTDPRARFLYVNPAYERALGFTPAEVIGKTPAQLVRSDAHTPEFWKELDRTLSSGQTWRGTLISRGRDGRYVHFDTTLTPVADAKGRITHHLGVKRDVTEELARQEALLEANRALEQARDVAVSASRAKSEFLANMSHELRTPLNAIIGYSEMLMEDAPAGEQTHLDLQRIRNAGTHLLTLINDVLDISKIEADKVDLVPERFALADLVADVQATVEPLARANDNLFTAHATAELGTIHMDRTRLRQILLNLLGNAFKFTRHGSVRLTVSRVMRGERPWIEVKVEDTGIGITDAQQKRLFQPFVQADSSTTREFGGTGLGLAICKRLTEIMRGEITLASQLGQGSTFTVRLPADEEDPSGELRAARRAGNPVVLLIDDDVEARELSRRTLARRGFTIVSAENGARGLELAGSIAPDAIVLDVKMPGMSGWEVLSTLKLDEATAAIPVIMMTVMHQKEVGQTLGAADFLIKPIDPDRLVDTLVRHTKTKTARVLVVEDDEPTRDLIRRTLEHRGNFVAEADNGRVALDTIDEARPDVVVLDLMMPVLDGFGFLHALRSNPRYAELPVIVTTARTLDALERDDLARNAQRVIEKSAHTRQELLGVIGDQINAIVARR